MKFKIITYGCTLNHTDSLKIRKFMVSAGWEEVNEDNADVYIINTCGVKHATEQKIVYRIKQMFNQHKNLIITGCLAYNIKLILNACPCASILGVRSVSMFPDTAQKLLRGVQVICMDHDREPKTNIITVPEKYSVIHPIAVQQGCTNKCTYCFTKFARPNLFSYPLKTITTEVEAAVGKGVKEIQLTGQDTGTYNYEGNTVADVLTRVCAVNGNFMVRLGMLNPEHMERLFNNLMNAYKNPKVYKFFHIPVQSGSNDVLKHMRRRYTGSQVRTMINKIRNLFTDAVIATDIIVGYPTENEHDFEQTIDLLKKVKFDIVNVSMFSVRPFTDAAKLKKLTSETIKKRSTIISTLAQQISMERNMKLVGQQTKVLVTEKGNRPGQVKARTNSYRQVIINDKIKFGAYVNVKITDVTRTSLVAVHD